jgi:hypothetical protein
MAEAGDDGGGAATTTDATEADALASTPPTSEAVFKDEEDDDAQKSRELPMSARRIMQNWLLSPQHFYNPYPTPEVVLVIICGDTNNRP